MNTDSSHDILDQLQQIIQGLNTLTQTVSQLNLRQHRIEERLTQVERCLVNLRQEANQSRNRPVWTDNERAAYALWLTEASEQDQGFPTLPVSGG
jgi:hypothetical protein